MKPNDIVKLPDGRVGWLPGYISIHDHESEIIVGVYDFFGSKLEFTKFRKDELRAVEIRPSADRFMNMLRKIANDCRIDEETFDENQMIGLIMAEVMRHGILINNQ